MNSAPMPGAVSKFKVPVAVTIQVCKRENLRDLEWFGMLSPHRELILSAYDRQERGEVLMLMAMINRFPAGQIWIDLARKCGESVGVLWALRVFPFMRNHGLGTRLIAAAEEILADRQFAIAELEVERKNQRPRRLYQRLGYHLSGSVISEYSYTQPDGVAVRVPLDLLVFRKSLTPVEQTFCEEVNAASASGKER